MDDRSKACAETVEHIIVGGAYKATKYLSDKLTVKATRKRYGDKKHISRDQRRPVDIVLTIGRPNYEERDFIKTAKKAGEPFPVKKVQLRFPKP